jgi:hypothetical protein
VLELQREAIKSNCVVADLVRNAYFIAKKLNIPNIQEWLTHELNQYPLENKDVIPEYRIIVMNIKGRTLSGWVSAIIDPNFNELEKFYCFFSIAEIEKIINTEDDFVYIKIPVESHAILCKLLDVETDFRGCFHKATLLKILEQVKTKILEWSIELENRGILGENLMFTSEEKSKAITINNNFYGNLKNTQIQQSSDNSSQVQSINETSFDLVQIKELVNEINEHSQSIKFTNESQSQDFNSNLFMISQELQSNTPNKSNIKASILSVKTILESVAASIITTGIIHSINTILN